MRRQIALKVGIVMPTIRIHDNMQFAPNDYAVKLRGTTVSTGNAHPGLLMAMNSGTADVPIDGIQTTKTAFGLPARLDRPDTEGAG